MTQLFYNTASISSTVLSYIVWWTCFVCVHVKRCSPSSAAKAHRFLHGDLTACFYTTKQFTISWCENRTIMWEQQYWLSKCCDGLNSVHTCVCSMEWSLKSKNVDIFLVGQSEWRQASAGHSCHSSQEIGNNTPFLSQMNVTKFL
jgi:hypothetical protein